MYSPHKNQRFRTPPDKARHCKLRTGYNIANNIANSSPADSSPRFGMMHAHLKIVYPSLRRFVHDKGGLRSCMVCHKNLNNPLLVSSPLSVVSFAPQHLIMTSFQPVRSDLVQIQSTRSHLFPCMRIYCGTGNGLR